LRSDGWLAVELGSGNRAPSHKATPDVPITDSRAETDEAIPNLPGE
jgi:hypothetical protein